MLPVLYNNHYQFVQTPDEVLILVEMNHNVRTIRIGAAVAEVMPLAAAVLDGPTHADPPFARKYLGELLGEAVDPRVVESTEAGHTFCGHRPRPRAKLLELGDVAVHVHLATLELLGLGRLTVGAHQGEIFSPRAELEIRVQRSLLIKTRVSDVFARGKE